MKFLVALCLVSYACGLPRLSFDNEPLLRPNVPTDSMTRPIYGQNPEASHGSMTRPIFGERPEGPNMHDITRPSAIPPPNHDVHHEAAPLVQVIVNFAQKESESLPRPPPEVGTYPMPEHPVYPDIEVEHPEVGPFPLPEHPENPGHGTFPLLPFPNPEHPENPDHGTFPLLPFPSPEEQPEHGNFPLLPFPNPEKPEHPIHIIPEEVPVGTFPLFPEEDLTRPSHGNQESLLKPAHQYPLIY